MPLLFALSFLALAEPIQAAPAAEQPKKEKKICKSVEPETGSRLRLRRCLTEAEWREEEERQKRLKDDPL
jgi:hypothetical protein